MHGLSLFNDSPSNSDEGSSCTLFVLNEYLTMHSYTYSFAFEWETPRMRIWLHEFEKMIPFILVPINHKKESMIMYLIHIICP